MKKIQYILINLILFLFFQNSYSFVPTIPENTYTWDEMELIFTKTKKINKEILLSDFNFPRGTKFKEDHIDEFEKRCNDLKQKFSDVCIECAMVFYPTGKVHPVIDVKEPAICSRNKSWIDRKSKIVLSSELQTIADEQINKYSNSIYFIPGIKLESREVKKGIFYIGYNNVSLDKDAVDLYKNISPSKHQILNVLLNSNDLDSVNKASVLINWVGLTKKDISNVIDHFPEIPDDSKNNIFLTLSLLSENLDTKEMDKLFSYIPEVIMSGSHFQRTKGLNLLTDALVQKPSFKSSMSVEFKKYIDYLSENSILDNIYIPANDAIQLMNQK